LKPFQGILLLETFGEFYKLFRILEDKLAQLVRRYFPGYEHIAIVYKIFVYLFFSQKSSDIYIKSGYYIEDVDLSLNGSTFFGYYDRRVENAFGQFILITKQKKSVFLFVYSSNLELLFKENLNIWNYQQGVLATWLNDEEIIYNKIYKGKVCGCRYNIFNGNTLILPVPFQSSSSCGKRICSIDIGVLKKVRPEYSYEMCEDTAFSNNNKKLLIMDAAGNIEIEIDYLAIKKLAFKNKEIKNFKLNHCIFSPSGRLLIFLARGWENGKKLHVLMCLDCDVKLLKLIIEDEVISHYNWLNDNKIVYWGTKNKFKSYHVIGLDTPGVITINTLKGDFEGDGHPAPVSSNEFITDTYPNRSRLSELKRIYINSDHTTKVEVIAQLKQPFKFYGSKRVDLHPRINTNGSIYIDSAHSGSRRLYKISKLN
jgi:hypothetical protein